MNVTAEITQGERNLLLLQSLIPKGENFFVWCYGWDGNLVGYSCDDEVREAFHQAFVALGGYDKMLAFANSAENDRPCFVGSSIGMQWGITMEAERNHTLVFVIGPVFYIRPDEKTVRTTLYENARPGMDIDWIDSFCAALPLVPFMSYAVFERYMLLVHNTVTGEQLGLEALRPQGQQSSSSLVNPVSNRNRLHVYAAEKALLDMVRNGDINYEEAFHRSSSLSPGVPVHGRDPLRQMKTSIIVFTSLVTRAAMEGGLSPEIAYPLGDSYIQAAEDCRDSGELNTLAHAMYHDFIFRVHRTQANPGCSHAIRKCLDYIALSLDQRILAKDLAQLVGYTEYYLTEKFKTETGLSVSDYIRQAKISRAKTLLQTTDLSISQISDKLAFNAPNYFIRVFRELEGCTPAQYRRNNAQSTGVNG